MDPSVRPATIDEAERLHELAAATFPLACPPSTTEDDAAAFIATQLSAERFAAYLADPGRSILVVDDGSALVGYTMTVFGEPSDPEVATVVAARPTAELSKCYLRPGAHGSGGAGRLVAAVLEDARARGLASVWLGVNQENLRANRFYEKSGFAVVGTKHFTVGSQTYLDWVREHPLESAGADG